MIRRYINTIKSKLGAFKIFILEHYLQSLPTVEFQTRFTDERSCLAHLENFKWGNGYNCSRCGNTNYCSGGREFSRQCIKCHHIDSPTSGTLFHDVRFPLLKAFYIVFDLSPYREGIKTSTGLSLKLGLRQKTCWLFMRKVKREMIKNGMSRYSSKLRGKIP